jgi:choline dehydrogenase-like flavoprotein
VREFTGCTHIPSMQIKRSPEVHDVVVIGSGAAGGMAAWNLTRKGVNGLVLDAAKSSIVRSSGRT